MSEYINILFKITLRKFKWPKLGTKHEISQILAYFGYYVYLFINDFGKV